MSLISKSWILFCVCSFVLLAFRTFDFSPYLEIRSYQTENRFIRISFYACFKLELRNENCSVSSDASLPKREFTCDFQQPVSCYTKGLQTKSPKQIIGLFKRCNLSTLVEPEVAPVTSSNKNLTFPAILLDNSELRLFFDQICVIIVYEIDTATVKGRNEATFSFGAKHTIPYSVKAVIDYGSHSSTDFIPVFKR